MRNPVERRRRKPKNHPTIGPALTGIEPVVITRAFGSLLEQQKRRPAAEIAVVRRIREEIDEL